MSTADVPVTAMIAWDMVGLGTLTPSDANTWLYKLNSELKPFKMKIKKAGVPQFSLSRRNPSSPRGNTGWSRRRRSQLCVGNLQQCCRRALTEIDPDNYPMPDKTQYSLGTRLAERRRQWAQVLSSVTLKGNHP